MPAALVGEGVAYLSDDRVDQSEDEEGEREPEGHVENDGREVERLDEQVPHAASSRWKRIPGVDGRNVTTASPLSTWNG